MCIPCVHSRSLSPLRRLNHRPAINRHTIKTHEYESPFITSCADAGAHVHDCGCCRDARARCPRGGQVDREGADHHDLPLLLPPALPHPCRKVSSLLLFRVKSLFSPAVRFSLPSIFCLCSPSIFCRSNRNVSSLPVAAFLFSAVRFCSPFTLCQTMPNSSRLLLYPP